MYRYLPAKNPDYTGPPLVIRPTTTLPQVGDSHQVVHNFDDGGVAVIGISSSNFFDVEIQWSYISSEDHDTLMDFWFNPAKGDKRARTFFWRHPIDKRLYVSRFLTPLSTIYSPVGHKSVSGISMRIEGRANNVSYTTMWEDYTSVGWAGYYLNWE